MDVRCERCRAQYVFGDDQVGPDGLTVRCSKCGHVFLVKMKALVVTVPVKPGELRQEPVSTADIHRAGTPAAAGPAASRREAEQARPWNLRNQRGDVYPFKDLSTLQRWIVERKAAREDEVSHQGGPWRRLGDMLELEPFFALVERADRPSSVAGRSSAGGRAERIAAGSATEARGPSVQPTLIDFPPPRPVFPGPGHKPAPAKTERAFPVPPEAADAERRSPPAPKASAPLAPEPSPPLEEGPVLRGQLPAVAGHEPAWTAHHGGRMAEREAKRSEHAPGRAGKRSRVPLLLMVAVLAAGGVGVYLTNPGWLGLPPTKPETASAGAETEGSQPPATGSPSSPAPPSPSPPPPSQRTPPSPSPSTPPSTSGQTPTPASPSGPPSTATATPSQAPMATPTPAPPLPAPQAPLGGEEPATQQKEASPAGAPPSEPPLAEAAPANSPPTDAPKVAEAAPAKPTAAVKPAEPKGPPTLKRLLGDARRLRARGRPEAALNMYGRAIELDQHNPEALAGRGLCYLELSQYRPAEASFHAALEADARHPAALMGLAETYRYEGRRAEAVTYYRKYLAAHPNGEDAVAARNAIDALKE